MTLTLESVEAMIASLAPLAPSAESRFKDHENGDVRELVSILEVLDPDVGRGDGSLLDPAGNPHGDYWFGVILAASRAYGEPAKEMLQRWSQASERYDPADFETVWTESLKERDRPVTVKSLRKLAKHHGWVQTPIANRYIPLDRDAIFAIPPIRWRLKGLFPETGIGAVYGPSGSGKSFLAIDLAVRISAGTPWYGRRTVACPVVYVVLEGEAGLRNRVHAWELHNGQRLPGSFTAIPQAFSFAEDEDVLALAAVIPKGSVVIVDTLNRAAPGKDENSSKDMGEVISGMKKLQRLTEGLVIVVHHTGKDASKGLRGHSSLHAALDGAIEVRRSIDGQRSWSSAKVKDGSDDIEQAFQLTTVILGTDEDGFIESCVAEPTVNIPRPPKPKGKNQATALRALQSLEGDDLEFERAVVLVAAHIETPEPKRRKTRAREGLEGLLNLNLISLREGHIVKG